MRPASLHLVVRGQRVEYQRFEPASRACVPTIVMLHEGLGSVSMWKDFPVRLASATGASVVAYSRFGHGSSDRLEIPYPALAMHETEALEVLPEVLLQAGIDRPILLGHSDGASIALIYAGSAPARVAGVVALAPHLFVEDLCIESIERAKRAFDTGDLRRRLAPYHDDPDAAFWGWNNVWLDPAFRRWNVEHYLPPITCRVLAVQGYDDEYGTMEQLERLARSTQQVELLKLEQCRHSPHRDQSELVLAAAQAFIAKKVLGPPPL